MNDNHTSLVVRRGELMAELFLQEMDPILLARPTALDVGYDLLVGFLNENGGVNTFAIETKAIERPLKRIQFPRGGFDRLSHSNIPGLLLVSDVKANQMYFAWLTPDLGGETKSVTIPLTEINDATKSELRKRFKAASGVAAAG